MFRNKILLLALLTLLIFILLLLILSYLLLQKWHENNFRAIVDEKKTKLHPLIIEYLLKGYSLLDFQIKNKYEYIAIEEILLKVSQLLEEETVLNQITMIANKLFSSQYRSNLKSKSWRKRMNTLYSIEQFRMEEMLTDVLHLMNNSRTSSEEKFQALRILAKLQHIEIEKFLHSYHLSEYENRVILYLLEPKLFNIMMLSFHRSNLHLQLAILDIIAIKSEIDYSSYVESIYNNYTGEVKIRAYKTLISIGYIKNPQQYIFLSTSDKWEVRMLTAKLFGTLKDPLYIPQLIQLIHDKEWWVRYYAGQALASFPEGEKALEGLRETSDLFAQDMAGKWLNRSELT